MSKKLLTLFSLLFLPVSFGLAEESITLTAYYPSPYGNHYNLTASNNVTLSTVADGRVGIGTTSPQSKLDVVTPANSYVSVGSALMGVGSYAGIHFGYREPNALYRKSAIVFERTDNAGFGGNAAGKVHILNGPASGSGSATLADARLTINELGNVGINMTSPVSKFVVKSNGAPYNAGLFFGGNTAFSILPYNGVVYLSAGTYYQNGVWQYYGTSGSSLLGISEISGVTWYSGTGASYSNVASGVTLWTASGVLQGAPSSKSLKENFTKLDPKDILDKINSLDISLWNYKSEGPSITHIGPVAEDFYRIFGTGDSDKRIAVIDEIGVALVGVKSLSQQVNAQQQQINDLKQEITLLKASKSQ